jgi:hypothetical protein
VAEGAGVGLGEEGAILLQLHAGGSEYLFAISQIAPDWTHQEERHKR